MPNKVKGPGRGVDSDEEGIEKEFVSHPRQTDVLCGRGGMSNHHPGNEWYRRLVKSNRPLYRACPKHTKLLVAKAIVQAVEQQQGRFLEKSRGNGLWHQVSYKRAVDKTSQGLREKDREGEEDIPGSLGDSPPTGTSDMTALVRHMSTRDPPPPQDGNSDFGVPPPPRVMPPNESNKKARTDSMVNGKPGPALVANPAPQNSTVMLPPETVGGATDKYRLLKHTPLLPKVPATTTVEHQQAQQLNSKAQMMQQQVRQQMLAAQEQRKREAQLLLQHQQQRLEQQRQQQQQRQQLEQQQQQQQQGFLSGQAPEVPPFIAQTPEFERFPERFPEQPQVLPSPAQAHPRQQQQSVVQHQQSATAGPPPPQQQLDTPTFTRFQSQVSDWLNSFWPLQDDNNTNATAAPAPSPPPPVAPQPQPDYHQSPSRKRKARYPPPTDPVEDDASQTLLQYATSSKLFRGFSLLFGGKTSTADALPTQGGGKPSLLDDYEETPMEARFRQVE